VNVFSESMQSAEEAEVRAILLKEEKNPVSFFYNQLWNTRAQILVAEEYPVFVPMVKKGWYTFLKSLRKKKTPEIEQEIPRDIL